MVPKVETSHIREEYELPLTVRVPLKCFGKCDQPILSVPCICCTLEGRKRRWHLECWQSSKIEVHEERELPPGRKRGMKCYGGCGKPIISVPCICWMIDGNKRWHVDCWRSFQEAGAIRMRESEQPDSPPEPLQESPPIKLNTEIGELRTYRDVGVQMPVNECVDESNIKTYCEVGVQTSADEYIVDRDLIAMDVDGDVPIAMDVDVEVPIVRYKRKLYGNGKFGEGVDDPAEPPSAKRFKPSLATEPTSARRSKSSRRCWRKIRQPTNNRLFVEYQGWQSYQFSWKGDLKDGNPVERYRRLREAFLRDTFTLEPVELNLHVWKPLRTLEEIAATCPNALLHTSVLYWNPYFAENLTEYLALSRYLKSVHINLASIPWPVYQGEKLTEVSIETYLKDRSIEELRILQRMFHPDKWIVLWKHL
ncbi:hypothetical protein MVEN_00064900 [Mycena venus]|uniref:Uncharacterized protein n=1 Tax=Mycena venus TaxID=2733690 RepID=A0A8H6Z968_9AGAR|nr:hypothetical protein MVEN_00064900 [Mycena venus]